MMDTKHKGSQSELIAAAWLLARGYEVFRNVSDHGEIDIVGVKDGSVFYFDVKSCDGKQKFRLKLSQVRHGIKILYVFDNGECEIDWAGPPVDPRTCKQCARSFEPVRHNQIFCDFRCRHRNKQIGGAAA